MSITKISPSVVDFDAGITISTADNTTQLTLKSTDADANTGPVLNLQRDSGSPADNDYIGNIKLQADNDAGEVLDHVSILGQIVDASDGTEDAKLTTYVLTAGTVRNALEINPTEIVINEDSIDRDFRVESDGNTHALFVQASDDKIGLGHSAPPNRLTILGDKDQTSANVYGGNTKWGLLAETPTYSDGDYVGLIASTTGNNNATKPKFGIWGLHAGSGSKMYFGVSSDYGSGLNVNWALNENGHFGPLASGHGIDFSVTGDGSGTDSSEVLDDYEEGTWTPTIATGSISFGNARYTKVGRLIHISADAQSPSDTSTAAAVTIGGLPYPVHGPQAGGSMFGTYSDNTNAMTCYVTDAEQAFFYNLSNASWVTLRHDHFNSGSAAFYFQATYHTT